MKNIRQKGFTLVEVLVVILVLVLTVGVGYYAYHARQNKKETSATSQTASKSAASIPSQASTPAEYVEFKDLGFKIKKSEKMNDWSYVDYPGVPLTKYVQSAAHVKKIDECNKGAPMDVSKIDKSFAAFSRIDGTYKEGESLGAAFVKQFDTFYISIGHPNGGSPCVNEKGVGYPVEIAPAGAQDVLMEALKNAEKL